MISYCSLTHTDSKRYHKHDTHWHILIYVCPQTGALYGFTCYPLHHHFDRFDSEQLKPPSTPGSSLLFSSISSSPKALVFFSRTKWSLVIFLFSQINIFTKGP